MICRDHGFALPFLRGVRPYGRAFDHTTSTLGNAAEIAPTIVPTSSPTNTPTVAFDDMAKIPEPTTVANAYLDIGSDGKTRTTYGHL